MSSVQTGPNEKPYVFRRTGMDALADLLIDEINAEFRRDGDLFRKIPVVVPNRSIRRYLSLRFAHRHGIATQIEFKPLMSVFYRFLPRNTARGRLNIDETTIGWRIYRILLEPGSETAFPVLTRWIGGDSKRLYDLSRQLGSLYDKYLLYRPDWINAWEAGAMPPGLAGDPTAVWQGELWRRVAGEDWKGNHFAAVYETILSGERALASGTGEPETIRIFGFSQLPPAVLRCLECFSGRGTTVRLYHLVPSEAFYEESRTRKDELREFLNRYFHEGQDPEQLREDLETLYFQHNPLVASFAMQSRILLSATSDWTDDADCGFQTEDTPDASGNGTVLHRLQDRIRYDRKPSDMQPERRAAEHACRSVQIRSCYSAFREVEAAHNFILHCLDEDPEMSLKDIFIMTPSPSDYAPLVDAVFNHTDGAMRLGVSIADQPRTERLPSYGTLMKALSLFQGDFTASDVFGILQDQELQAHWGITAEDCRYCLERAVRAGIRWGWDAGEHSMSGGKAFPENSWQAGFDRMLLDYALESDPAAPYRLDDGGEIFPVPGFDGGRAELLGKFISLTAKLHEIAQFMRRRERDGVPFREWETMLADAAGWLFGRDSELKVLLLGVLSAWRQVLTDADTEDVPLTGGIVLAYLQDKHARPEDNTMGFMRGRITFCGLRPMRSIPADAILLLGMDHGAFPEEDDNREFDIMQQYRETGNAAAAAGREPGDPLRRDESRQLFLDTIMAARKYLYISYIGRDNHDRKEKPPSACVDELKSYLTQEFGENSFVELQEPVHSFSAELFRAGRPNQSYSASLLAAAKRIADQSAHVEEKPLFDIRGGIPSVEQTQTDLLCRTVELEDLKWFFANPAGTYVRKGLEASVTVWDAASPEDSELFDGGLDWGLKDELFEAYLEAGGQDPAALKRDFLKRMKADGTVPLMQDEDDWEDWSTVVMLADAVKAAAGGGTELRIPAEEIAMEYSAGDSGDLARQLFDPVPDGVFQTTLILPEMKVYLPAESGAPCVRVTWSFSREISGALLVRPLLDHLRANLGRKTVTKIVYCSNRDRIVSVAADALERAEAESVMRRFLCLFRAGLRKPLPFFPKTSYAFFTSQDENRARSVWNGGFSSGEVDKFGEFFGAALPFDGLFTGLAELFFGSVAFH